MELPADFLSLGRGSVTSLGHLGISSKKWRNHLDSSSHLSSAINLDSIVDLTITICFEDFHETAPPPSVNT